MRITNLRTLTSILFAGLIACALALAAVIAYSDQACASTRSSINKNLFAFEWDQGVSKTINTVDVTGDRKKDEIYFYLAPDYGYGGDRKLMIYVNGRRAYTFSESAIDVDVKYLRLNNGKSFLCLKSNYGTWSNATLLGYKKSRFVSVLSKKNKLISGLNYSVDAIKAKGRNLRIRYLIKIYKPAPDFGTKYYTLLYTYRLKNGKFKAINQITGSFRNVKLAIKKPVALHPKLSSKSTKGVLAKKTKVRVGKVGVRNSRLYYFVRTDGGKTGWVAAAAVNSFESVK